MKVILSLVDGISEGMMKIFKSFPDYEIDCLKKLIF